VHLRIEFERARLRAGISTETGWRSGINQNLDPEVAKRIAKKLCKGAVVNICSCAAAKNDAKLQRLANKPKPRSVAAPGTLKGVAPARGSGSALSRTRKTTTF
jgi:hypothetical protein